MYHKYLPYSHTLSPEAPLHEILRLARLAILPLTLPTHVFLAL